MQNEILTRHWRHFVALLAQIWHKTACPQGSILIFTAFSHKRHTSWSAWETSLAVLWPWFSCVDAVAVNPKLSGVWVLDLAESWELPLELWEESVWSWESGVLLLTNNWLLSCWLTWHDEWDWPESLLSNCRGSLKYLW